MRTRAFQRLTAGAGAAALVAAVGLVGVVGATSPASADTGTQSITNDATFSWAVNEESGGGAFFGGANWLVAGEVGNVHGERGRGSSVWDNQDEKHFTNSSGNTTITRPDADGNQVPATWDRRNHVDPVSGDARLNTQPGSSSMNQANIANGTGTLSPASDSATIQWDGSFTIVYYGGMTYWTINDPKLVVEDGVGTVTATLTGYGADMFDLSKWVKLDAKTNQEIATLTGVTVTDSGIEATPEYEGVEIEIDPDGPSGQQNRDRDGWGSFPQNWIDFNVSTGQAAYWYTSGGQVDPKKTAEPISIEYTTEELQNLDPGYTPHQPEKVSATEDSSSSSTITWERPTGASAGPDGDEGALDEQDGRYPPAYQVQWAPGERDDEGRASDWTGRTVDGAVTTTTASGLDPSTTYTARVRSMNHDEGQSGSSYGLSSDWVYKTFTTDKETKPSPAPTPEPPEDDGDGAGDGGGDDGGGDTGDGAVFRWAMNREAGSGAFFGGCNFLSAGISGDYGRSEVWADDSLYSSSEGNVTIRKATSSGGWTEASWATKCQDRNGLPVSPNGKDQWNEQQVVITGGEREQLDDGGERIEWDGSFTVAFYGGMTYWWATDPVLEVDGSGNGIVTATASGYGASMYDASKWEQLDETTITLATLRGVDTDRADSDGGFTVTPEYLGVSYNGTGGEGDAGDSRVGGEEGNPTAQAAKSAENEAYWGSFPSDFIDFQNKTGQFSYWFTSGGIRDPFKPTEPLVVAYSGDYDSGPGDYSGEGGGGSAASGAPGAGAPGAGGNGSPASATNPNAGKKPGEGASPEDANFDEDRSAFSEMAQQAAGDSSLNGRTFVIAGLTAGAGLAATITSVVYFRRRLGLDPRMFL
jgi:hypothetical protein